MSKVFLSYRRVEPDQRLAGQIVTSLETAGHSVFQDARSIKVGTDWAQEIKTRLTEAQFFVVLLSAESVRSEWVLKEIRLAYRCSRRERDPLKILPVRVAYAGNLPARLAVKLDRIQHTVWQNRNDDARVAQDIAEAVGQARPLPTPLVSSDAGVKALHAVTEHVGAPLPQAEVLFETGAEKLGSPFYIERDADAVVLSQVLGRGTTTVIKGPRQSG